MIIKNKLELLWLQLLLSLVLFSCVKPATQNNIEWGTSNLSDTTIRNVSYGSNTRQVYDIYLPSRRDTNTPVVLLIHGGAWKAGQKEDMNNYVNLIRSKWSNVAVVNMNYRLANNANNIHHNEIIADIQATINHLLLNKNSYQISSRFGVAGASAGGQLGMIYAYKYNPAIKCVGNIFGPSIINDWSWYNSTNPWLGGYTGDILAEYVGQTWDTTAYKAVSPYSNITVTSPPTIMFHGNLDPIVPVYQSQWMHNKLNTIGVPNQYYEYVAFHGFDDTQNNDVVSKLVSFFKTHINR
jgi:acetyl esterase/lipase